LELGEVLFSPPIANPAVVVPAAAKFSKPLIILPPNENAAEKLVYLKLCELLSNHNFPTEEVFSVVADKFINDVLPVIFIPF
jgi:hypothetical protein